MAVSASILICTRNRLSQLRETLVSVGSLRIPNGIVPDLVVIDNGSTDGTADWVRGVTLPNMPVRLVSEPRAGTGYARTTAMYATSAEILLFTDDDVRLPEEWLAALTKPILDGRAEVVGGTSVLHESLHRPWMSRFHRASLSSMEDAAPGDDPGPFTISVAISRTVLDLVPAFDPELGPGSRCGFLEDVLFFWQIQLAGIRILRDHSVPVVHLPSEDRLTRTAWLRSARARGRSRSYIRYHWQHWDGYQFTHRSRASQWWRHPYVVLLKRWVQLVAWRVRHLSQIRRTDGITYREFALVNLYYQIREYLAERGKARHYEFQGLVKQRGLLPDTHSTESLGGDGVARRPSLLEGRP